MAYRNACRTSSSRIACCAGERDSFALDQIDEEIEVTGQRGAGHARADFVICRTIEERRAQQAPLIIVECKSDNITIAAKDYFQGDNYARIADAKFVVTHNNKGNKILAGPEGSDARLPGGN